MSAITWFPGLNCQGLTRNRPDWGAVLLDGKTNHDGLCCFNSPFGEALIAFILESLEIYNLDGFWLDGVIRSSGDGPGCVCEHCCRRFRENTGLEAPQNEDWNSDTFRRWVAWRYDDFAAYWTRLNAIVRRAFPRVRIVINHLHRIHHSWYVGMPLNKYSAEVICGSESQDDPFVSALHGNLQLAYGKTQSELWMGLHKLFTKNTRWPEKMDSEYRYIHHALASIATGVMPSFGTPDPGEKLTGFYERISSTVTPLVPWLEGTNVRYSALLVSQQAETFAFGSPGEKQSFKDYWNSLLGWHNLLVESQLPVEVIFDGSLAGGSSHAWPVIIAPMAAAVSKTQLDELRDYVDHGGILVVDKWFATRNEWGVPVDESRLEGLKCMRLSDNIGLQFYEKRNRDLVAESTVRKLKEAAPPWIKVEGPLRLHVTLRQRPGKLILFLRNSIAWSESETFPNPILSAPKPTGKVKVTLSGFPVTMATALLDAKLSNLSFENDGYQTRLAIADISWMEIIEFSY